MSNSFPLSNAADTTAGKRTWARAVSVYAGERDNHIKGSGIALDRDHVLTTSHVIEESGVGDIFIFHPARSKATRVFEVVAQWKREDIALLRLDRKLQISEVPAKIANALDLYEPVFSVDTTQIQVRNKEQDGARTIQHGLYARQRRYMGKSHHAQFEMATNFGTCGAGIVNQRGEVVSVNFGRNETATATYGTDIVAGVTLSKLKHFLGQTAPGLVAL